MPKPTQLLGKLWCVPEWEHTDRFGADLKVYEECVSVPHLLVYVSGAHAAHASSVSHWVKVICSQ